MISPILRFLIADMIHPLITISMLILGCSTKYWTPWPLLQYLLEGFFRLLVLVHLHFFISQIGDCDPKDYLGHPRSRIVLT